MAKIRLMGGETLSVPEADARRVQESLKDPGIKGSDLVIVRLEPLTERRKSAVRGVDFISTVIHQYDIHDPQHREILLAFEKDLGGMQFRSYAIAQKYIIIRNGQDWIVRQNIREYEDAKAKHDGVLALRWSKLSGERRQHWDDNGSLGIKCECEKYCNPPSPLKALHEKLHTEAKAKWCRFCNAGAAVIRAFPREGGIPVRVGVEKLATSEPVRSETCEEAAEEGFSGLFGGDEDMPEASVEGQPGGFTSAVPGPEYEPCVSCGWNPASCACEIKTTDQIPF